jgi:hypothetical protein
MSLDGETEYKILLDVVETGQTRSSSIVIQISLCGSIVRPAALGNSRLRSVSSLWVTHCSHGKNPIREGTPAELYRSGRISEFITYCSRLSHSWAILSVKYGLFFPDEKRASYDVTLKSDRETKQCLIAQDGVLLNSEQSSAWMKRLIDETNQRINSKGIGSIVFWPGRSYGGVDPLMRVKCYLKFLHAAADCCNVDHLSWREIIDHTSTLWKSGLEKINLIKDLPP